MTRVSLSIVPTNNTREAPAYSTPCSRLPRLQVCCPLPPVAETKATRTPS